MKVLIACEESQEVCKAFRAKGHEAFSNDIIKCSGNHPEWHILDDCLNTIKGGCFNLENGGHLNVKKWDLIIAHPPCTYLTCAGNRWFNIDRYGTKAIERHKKRIASIAFFLTIVNEHNSDKLAIENPIGVMSSYYRKPDQIIQPYQFGHNERKATCLWLKGLRKLKETNCVEPNIIRHASGRTDSELHFNTLKLPQDERSKIRSKTFKGIAEAMAEQWG